MHSIGRGPSTPPTDSQANGPAALRMTVRSVSEKTFQHVQIFPAMSANFLALAASWCCIASSALNRFAFMLAWRHHVAAQSEARGALLLLQVIQTAVYGGGAVGKLVKFGLHFVEAAPNRWRLGAAIPLSPCGGAAASLAIPPFWAVIFLPGDDLAWPGCFSGLGSPSRSRLRRGCIASELSTDAVVATGAAGCGLNRKLVTPAAEASEAAVERAGPADVVMRWCCRSHSRRRPEPLHWSC